MDNIKKKTLKPNRLNNLSKATDNRLLCLLTLLTVPLLLCVLCACTEVPQHCGDGAPSLDPSTQFCFGGEPYFKCGGIWSYNPNTQECYNNEYVRDKTSYDYYTITFNANGGIVSPTSGTTDTDGKLTTDLPTPTRDNYTFNGWFTATTGGTQVSTSTVFTSNATIHAQWTATATTYTVTVSRNPTNGGSVSVNGTSNPSGAVSYNAGTSMTLTASASSGYTFNNWTATTGSLPSGVTATNATLTFTISGNVSIQANFTKNPTGGVDDVYESVTIGTQKWMKKNLNIATESGSWCYNNSADSCAKYGRLYDWATAMNINSSYNSSTWGGSDVKHQGVCPSGWHLPSREEWDTLVDYVGGSSVAGQKLKATSGWYNNGNGTDAYGFSALPGGYRGSSDGSFDYAGNDGRWWTATEYYSDYAYRRRMLYSYGGLLDYDDNKDYGFSVRCVGD